MTALGWTPEGQSKEWEGDWRWHEDWRLTRTQERGLELMHDCTRVDTRGPKQRVRGRLKTHEDWRLTHTQEGGLELMHDCTRVDTRGPKQTTRGRPKTTWWLRPLRMSRTRQGGQAGMWPKRQHRTGRVGQTAWRLYAPSGMVRIKVKGENYMSTCNILPFVLAW